jgi:hypothetical protein
MDLGKYAYMAKAIAAFIALLVPFLVSVGAALVDGKITVEEVTVMGTAAGALAVGTRAVFQVKNKVQ